MLDKRIMGLDYGSKTIGVAVSDLLGFTAQGIETININEQVKDFKIKRIKELVQEHNVGTIVVGLPKNMDNSVGFRGEATLYFVEVLKKKIKDVEIILQDERLTTMGAERVLLEANVSRKKRKNVKMQEKDLKNISIDNTEEVYTLSTLEGEEKEYRKILEFTNPTNGNLYYIFAEEETIDEEEISIFPMVCVEDGEDSVRFEPVETDEEYDMISEVLDTFYYDESE